MSRRGGRLINFHLLGSLSLCVREIPVSCARYRPSINNTTAEINALSRKRPLSLHSRSCISPRACKLPFIYASLSLYLATSDYYRQSVHYLLPLPLAAELEREDRIRRRST